MEIILNVDKAKVIEEVSRTTSYAGAKMEEDRAYDRMYTTDADDDMLERFWEEGKDAVCSRLKRLLSKEGESGGTYSVELDVSSSFDDSLEDSMNRSLFSFFVTSIISKWFTFTNKADAPSYAEQANAFIDDVAKKAFYKKKPTRPTYKI